MGRVLKAIAIHLSEDERAELEKLCAGEVQLGSRPACPHCARVAPEPGATNAGVARGLGVSRPGVTTWRARFAARELDRPVDLPRPKAPRRAGDDQIERLITLTLETKQADATHWSAQAMVSRV